MEDLYRIPSKSCSNLKRRAFWAKAIVDQSVSGLSLVKFCNLHGLKFSTFKGYKYARKKIKAVRCNTNDYNKLIGIQKDTTVAKFIPLQITADVATNKYPKKEIADEAAEIKIVFKNNHRLFLPSTLTEIYLLSIIKIVAELQC